MVAVSRKCFVKKNVLYRKRGKPQGLEPTEDQGGEEKQGATLWEAGLGFARPCGRRGELVSVLGFFSFRKTFEWHRAGGDGYLHLQLGE